MKYLYKQNERIKTQWNPHLMTLKQMFQRFQVDLSVKLLPFNIFPSLVLKFTDTKRSL
jgi:hypothetical protein